MATKSPRNDNAGRNRKKVTKFALAGVAVLGVGAALTSAAWTDNVFFAAAATSGSIDLEGSTDNATWADGTNYGAAIIVDPAEFNDMAPLESRTVTLYLRNNGQGTLNLSGPSALASFGDFFDGVGTNDFTSIAFTPYVDATLSPAETTSFDVTLTAPNWGNIDQNNNTSVLVVDVQAST